MSEIPELPKGLRFDPEDEQLISLFLRKWIHNQPVALPGVVEVKDVYGGEPWDLDHKIHPILRENEWYYFVTRKRAGKGKRPRRDVDCDTLGGWWRGNEGDKNILSADGQILGFKKSLTFFRYKKEKGNRKEAAKSDWIMHEYRLASDCFQEKVLCRIRYNGTDKKFSNSLADMAIVDAPKKRSKRACSSGQGNPNGKRLCQSLNFASTSEGMAGNQSMQFENQSMQFENQSMQIANHMDHRHPDGNCGSYDDQDGRDYEISAGEQWDQNADESARFSMPTQGEFGGVTINTFCQPLNFESTSEGMAGNQGMLFGNHMDYQNPEGNFEPYGCQERQNYEVFTGGQWDWNSGDIARAFIRTPDDEHGFSQPAAGGTGVQECNIMNGNSFPSYGGMGADEMRNDEFNNCLPSEEEDSDMKFKEWFESLFRVQ